MWAAKQGENALGVTILANLALAEKAATVHESSNDLTSEIDSRR